MIMSRTNIIIYIKLVTDNIVTYCQSVVVKFERSGTRKTTKAATRTVDIFPIYESSPEYKFTKKNWISIWDKNTDDGVLTTLTRVRKTGRGNSVGRAQINSSCGIRVSASTRTAYQNSLGVIKNSFIIHFEDSTNWFMPSLSTIR